MLTNNGTAFAPTCPRTATAAWSRGDTARSAGAEVFAVQTRSKMDPEGFGWTYAAGEASE